MARAFLKVFFDFEERTEKLSETERGRLLLGMLHYASTGEEPDLSGNEQFLWPVFRKEIDQEIASYETRVANGRLGGRPASGTDPKETEGNLNKPKQTETNRNGQEQEQEQEQEKETDDDDDLQRAREAVGLSFRENFGRAGTPEEVRDISVSAALMGFGPELAGEAVRRAAKFAPRSPLRYVKRILEEWRSEGVRSVEDADRLQVRNDNLSGRNALFPFCILAAKAGGT